MRSMRSVHSRGQSIQTSMKRSRLRRVNPERAKENEQYLRESRIFLICNPICQLCGILRSTQVHHAAGRERKLLLIKKYWRAVCLDCHKWIHTHGKQARKTGWIVRR